MRETSNPVFRSLPKQRGGYATFGTGVAPGYGADPYLTPYQQARPARPLTIDDVVTKTGITLALLSATAVVSYFLVASNLALAAPFGLVGGLGGFALAMFMIFTNRQDKPALVLTYAALEGLFLGAFSFLLTFNVHIGSQSPNAGAMIGEAILGTLGVFFGMLVVYKTGAIRVTPKFTRMVVAALFGAVLLMVGNLIMGLFTHDAGPLRDGGTLAIIFSLVCIGIAAFVFLIDFDAADQMVRAGAPEKAAWGIAFGLTVTLVWLYTEILRLISYFQSE